MTRPYEFPFFTNQRYVLFLIMPTRLNDLGTVRPNFQLAF